jgi:hypothetical protein
MQNKQISFPEKRLYTRMCWICVQLSSTPFKYSEANDREMDDDYAMGE